MLASMNLKIQQLWRSSKKLVFLLLYAVPVLRGDAIFLTLSCQNETTQKKLITEKNEDDGR